LIKNTKRILSLVLSCVFACSGFQGVAARGSDRLEKAKNLLSALNIAEDDTNSVVTRERFADIYVRANNMYTEGYESKNPFSDTEESEYAEAIEIMRDYGIVSGVGNNCYAPTENMRTSDIAKLYVSALGMEYYAEVSGKGYIEIAHEVNLFDGVTISDYITMDNLIIMTYNLLLAPVGVQEFTNDAAYSIKKDTDFLYEKFDIFDVTGQVVQNDLSGIWSADGTIEGYVVIKTKDGEITALAADSGISSMLGHTLDIYLYEGEDEYEVVCFEKRENEQSVYIDIKNIDFDRTDSGRISYSKDGKGFSAYERLADFPSIIINGVYYDAGQFDFDVLRNYSGTVKLISNGKSEFDIVIVEAFTNYFVKNVEHYNGEMRIYDKGSNEALILDEQNFDKMEIYYPNGAAASPFELQSGMLLTVSKSFGRDSYINIYICDEVKEGTISGYERDEKLLGMNDGTTYHISPSYHPSDVSLGMVAKLYLDKFGDVAWLEYDKTAVFSYAYMIRPFINEDKTNVIAKVVAETGKFTNMQFAETVEIDGMKIKAVERQLSELENVDKIPNLSAGEYPFRYRLNNNGEIKEIDTPRIRIGYEDKHSFRVTASGADVICSNDKILGKQTPLSAETVMFLIPEATATEEKDNPAFYTIGNNSLVNTGGENTYTAFQIGNDSLYANLVIRTQKGIGGGLNHDNVLFLVDEIRTVYDNKTDEVRTKIFGLEGGTAKEYFLHNQFDETQLTDIKRGDVLRFAFYGGEISAFDRVFVYNSDTTTYTGKYHLPSGGQKASSLAQIGTSYYYSGYVMKREGRLIEILPFDLSATGQSTGVDVPNIPDWSIETRRVLQAPSKISIYDPSLGDDASVYSGDLEDIPAYEDGGRYVKVIVRYRSRSAQEMIVLKDESLFQ